MGYTFSDIVGIAFLPHEVHPNGRFLNHLYLSSRGVFERSNQHFSEVYNRLFDEVEYGGAQSIEKALESGELEEKMKLVDGKPPEFVKIWETFGLGRILICYIMERL